MKKTILVVGLLILLVELSGCIAIVGNEGGFPNVECAKRLQCQATIAEIDAAGKLTSEPAKVEGYKLIAQRPGLRGPERVHLIEAVDKDSISSSAKEEILLALLRNPPVPEPQKTAEKKRGCQP